MGREDRCWGRVTIRPGEIGGLDKESPVQRGFPLIRVTKKSAPDGCWPLGKTGQGLVRSDRAGAGGRILHGNAKVRWPGMFPADPWEKIDKGLLKGEVNAGIVYVCSLTPSR